MEESVRNQDHLRSRLSAAVRNWSRGISEALASFTGMVALNILIPLSEEAISPFFLLSRIVLLFVGLWSTGIPVIGYLASLFMHSGATEATSEANKAKSRLTGAAVLTGASTLYLYFITGRIEGAEQILRVPIIVGGITLPLSMVSFFLQDFDLSRDLVDQQIALLKSANPKARRLAAESLAKLGEMRAVDPLLNALDDSVLYVRCAAAKALVELGDHRGVGPLIILLGSADEDCSQEALEVLDGITGQSYGSDQDQWETWWENRLKHFGEHAIPAPTSDSMTNPDSVQEP